MSPRFLGPQIQSTRSNRGMLLIAETIRSLAGKVIAGQAVNRSLAEWLVEEVGPDSLPDLLAGATRIREQFFGKKVSCCSIVAGKVGLCSEDCAFCSQSGHYATHVAGGKQLTDAEILRAAEEAAAGGASSFGIVNSGLGPSDAEIEACGRVIGQLRARGGLGACASLGVVTESQARRLAALGVQRYNHNLQTSRRFFPYITATHRYDERLQALRNLKAAGIELCCGALFGMGETWSDRLDLAFELRALEPVVVPLNFLIPIAGTPLAGQRPLEPLECLKIIAIYRFILPTQDLKVAGGREVNIRDLQSWIFAAGATSFLIGNYLTTCGRPAEADRKMVCDLGLALVGCEDLPKPPGAASEEDHGAALSSPAGSNAT
ncbi:MAG TPA: biotin synthase BioB [Phycisphaerae bacterium]|nr:biotin synthase BioB [Phycisphaerae bacterium]HRY67319.1 biotin synthase BioB [Phycisphaerae bacterium]